MMRTIFRCAKSAADCRAMPRKRDVNLSHCGNAISRMWSPFGWVRNGVLARRETPRQGIRCLLPPEQIFPAAKVWSGEKRVAETQTAAQTGGGGVATAYNLSSIGWRLCLSVCDMLQVPRSMSALFGQREVPPKADRETARSRREQNQCRILP